MHRPWWLSVAIVLYAVAVMFLRRRQGVVAQRRSPGRWVEDLLAADRQSGNWWSAPSWML
ncbi:hypothetical protein [Kribbella sp. C-35]|uniref:hypothetical protein n=1 Tax=Kribbella sp. C-35 TaxID=2789276 RepID=UPI003979C0F3